MLINSDLTNSHCLTCELKNVEE